VILAFSFSAILGLGIEALSQSDFSLGAHADNATRLAAAIAQMNALPTASTVG